MKATLNISSLRAYMAFTVVAIFTVFLSSCKKPDPVVPVIETTIPTVTTVSITKLTPASAEVKGEIVSDGGEAITAAGICWAGVEPNIYSNLVPATVKSGAYTATVSNLQQKTAYYFRAYATNKNGTAYGESVYFYDASVIAPVKAFAAARPATNVTMTSATIAAVLVPNEKDTKATFEWHEIHDGLWTIVDLALGLESNLKDSIKLSSKISGLDPGKSYSYRLVATNSAGKVVSAESTFTTYEVSDLDGNLYHTVQIGDQIWLQENLRTTKYANGDPIANITDPTAWGKLTTGAYCWYNNDPKVGEVYGGLYNFYVGTDNRKLIKGYHVPTMYEWKDLQDYLQSNTNSAGWQLMETGTAHWLETSSAISNSTGFTALPNGEVDTDNNNNVLFMSLGKKASFWSSTIFGPGAVGANLTMEYSFIPGKIYDQRWGAGLRLIKDK